MVSGATIAEPQVDRLETVSRLQIVRRRVRARRVTVCLYLGGERRGEAGGKDIITCCAWEKG
jgi:hypothetical protein